MWQIQSFGGEKKHTSLLLFVGPRAYQPPTMTAQHLKKPESFCPWPHKKPEIIIPFVSLNIPVQMFHTLRLFYVHSRCILYRFTTFLYDEPLSQFLPLEGWQRYLWGLNWDWCQKREKELDELAPDFIHQTAPYDRSWTFDFATTAIWQVTNTFQ